MTAAQPDPHVEDIQQLKKLGQQLHYHNERYYGQSQPEISDADYDALFDAYEALANQLKIPEQDRAQTALAMTAAPALPKSPTKN